MTFSKKNKHGFHQSEDLMKYGYYYSEDRFWRKIKRLGKKVGGEILRPILLLYFLLQDRQVPLKDKAYIVGALGYFIMPIDLIPDFISVIGFTDDIAVMTFLLKELKQHITPDIQERVNELIEKIIR